MGGIAVYIGAAILIVLGGGFAIWPRKVASYLTHDEDNNWLPVTESGVRRTVFAGLALIALGAVLIWYGPNGFKGSRDMGAP